jgi:hypothetical protein
VAYLKVPLKINHCGVGFEVLTAVVMKNSIFRDIFQCTPLKVTEGSKAKALLAASCQFFAWFTLHSRRWRQHVPPEHQFTFSELHNVISQKTELFKSLS